MNGSYLEISLDPNESAVEELQKKLNSGIQVYGFTVTIEDPNNCPMSAAHTLDQSDKIGLQRRCTVVYSMSGFTKVIVKSVSITA